MTMRCTPSLTAYDAGAAVALALDALRVSAEARAATAAHILDARRIDPLRRVVACLGASGLPVEHDAGFVRKARVGGHAKVHGILGHLPGSEITHRARGVDGPRVWTVRG